MSELCVKARRSKAFRVSRQETRVWVGAQAVWPDVPGSGLDCVSWTFSPSVAVGWVCGAGEQVGECGWAGPGGGELLKEGPSSEMGSWTSWCGPRRPLWTRPWALCAWLRDGACLLLRW